jgi:hypothetical protein
MLIFEDRPRQIKVIRADVDANGAASREVVGSVLKRDLELNEELRSTLTADEVYEVKAIIDSYKKANDLRVQHLALTFPAIVREVMEYFETATTTERSLIGAGILDGLRRLRKFERSVGKQNAGGGSLEAAESVGGK